MSHHHVRTAMICMLSAGVVAAPTIVGSAMAAAPPVNSLQSAWNTLVTKPGLVHSSVSAYAYDITTHKVLASIHPSQRETPGSVTKLFTSAAALAQLGPNYTYTTKVVVPPSVAAGQPGPIYLVGGGDPWLEANGGTDLESLASQVASKVKAATGVIGVSSAFSPPVYGIGWPKDDLPQNYAAGTSALMAERNEIFVDVKQAKTAGSAPTVSLSFNSKLSVPSYFHVIDKATTGAKGSIWNINVTRRIGTNDIVVTGNLPLSGTAKPNVSGTWVLSVGNPPLFTASLFQKALSQDGVSFTTDASVASTAPSGTTTVATHVSPTLAKYLPTQNQYSINQMAENLYRALGMKSSGTGSLSASSAAMAAFSKAAGISPSRVQMDGSGLSPLDETSGQEMVELLSYASTQPWFSTFRGSLMHLNDPNACGILCPSYWSYKLPAHTDIWVKTGNLSNQWNYAGYAKAKNGDLIAFAVLNDGEPTSANAYKGSPADQMMQDVASWPSVPAPSSSQTTPPAPQGTLPPNLKHVLDRLAGRDSGTTLGVSVVNVNTKKVVYQEDGGTMLRAGLLPRLVLDDAGLQDGSSALPKVTVERTGSVSHGTLNGSLVLNGHGDTALTSANLTQLAHAIAKSGITQVSGSVQYVNAVTGFHASRWPTDMAWNDFGRAWTPPSSNLMVNGDQATLKVTAGTVGGPATATLSPSDVPIELQNNTVTTASGSASLHVNLTFNGDTFVLSGSVPKGYAGQLTIAPPDPGAYAATEFTDALKNAGLSVNGSLSQVASDPGGTTVASLPGPTMASLVQGSLGEASIAPSEAIASQLGSKLWPDIGKVVGTSPNYLNELTGGAQENYLTPNGVSAMLAKAYGNRSEAPLVRAISNKLWTTESPEQDAVAGYIQGPHQTVYAVTVMLSGVLWNHHFTAQILH